MHAIVYKKINDVTDEIRGLVRVVDPQSGEIEFINDELEAQYSRNPLLAADFALGNAALISEITNSLDEKYGGKCQVLRRTFLHSGSHAGDFVRIPEVVAIKGELDAIKSNPHVEPELQEFAQRVAALVEAALAEGNPIVFT